jgi:hypothetical protein
MPSLIVEKEKYLFINTKVDGGLMGGLNEFKKKW